MLIIGQTPGGREVLRRQLAHGEDPAAASFRAGYAVLAPVAAWLEADEIILQLAVEPVHDHEPPELERRGRSEDLVLAPGEQIQIKQRIAAYAIVTSERGLLATEYSDLVGAAGHWGLPGGGIDPGETPTAAVLREVHEETGQHIELGQLVAVLSGHFIGRSPGGVAEDFHTVRLVYRAHAPRPTDPVVHDVGGTTASARWLPLDAWDSVPWTPGWLRMAGWPELLRESALS